LEIEPFVELFTDNIIYVGPYSDTDARNMLQDLVKRNNKKYDAYTLDFLLWATGRYAGLLRSGFRALDSLGVLEPNAVMTMSDQIVRDLASKRSVRIECRTIWTSLSTKERVLLKEFTSAKPDIDPNDFDTQQTFALLQQKKLLSVQGNRVVIEPPVFHSFVFNNPDEEAG